MHVVFGRRTGACHIRTTMISITLCDSLILLQWFQLLGKREIQVLISGAEVSINVEGIMVNTHYSGTSMCVCVWKSLHCASEHAE